MLSLLRQAGPRGAQSHRAYVFVTDYPFSGRRRLDSIAARD